VSAEIIHFIPRRDHKRQPARNPAMHFASRSGPDDLVMDHADTAPCEYLWLVEADSPE
jgi:hypothetical protein